MFIFNILFGPWGCYRMKRRPTAWWPNSTMPTSPWRPRQVRDKPVTSPLAQIPLRRLPRNILGRRNGIWAKGTSRVCRGRHREVGIVEFGLDRICENIERILMTWCVETVHCRITDATWRPSDVTGRQRQTGNDVIGGMRRRRVTGGAVKRRSWHYGHCATDSRQYYCSVDTTQVVYKRLT